MAELEINVNELNELIHKAYGNRGYISRILVADINNQRNPVELKVGFGGVLSVFYDAMEDDE